MSDWITLVLWLVVVVLPFQLVGLASYRLFKRSHIKRARRAAALLPAVACFIVFLALYMWNYYHPQGMGMVDAIGNLFLLVMLVAGSVLNLLCGLAVQFLLRRREIK